MPKVSNCKEYNEAREQCMGIIQRHEDGDLWDKIQLNQVPDEVLQFVTSQLEKGFTPTQIRRALGFKNRLNKGWVLIMRALRGSARADGILLLRRWMTRNEMLANRLEKYMGKAMLDDKGKLKNNLGEIGKEVAAVVREINNLQLGITRAGKELGVFEEAQQAQGTGGTTIVVNNNIPVPTEKEINQHNAKRIAKGDAIEAKYEIKKPETEVHGGDDGSGEVRKPDQGRQDPVRPA